MTTKIEIPAENWVNWPTEPGWYFIGKPGTEAKHLEPISSSVLRKKKGVVPGIQLSNYFAVALGDPLIRQGDGYRFAKIELPIIPEVNV